MGSALLATVASLGLFLSVVMPSIYVLPPFLLAMRLGLVSPRQLQRFCSWVCGSWLLLTISTLETVLGIRFRTFGYGGQLKRTSLLLMNHRMHLDWMFLWAVLARQGSLASFKAVMKQLLRKFPVAGPIIELSNHIFLDRKWEKDRQELRHKLDYYNSLRLPLSLLFFPEGGDFTPDRKEKSDKFAEQNGYPRYSYCLHPRTRGFVCVVQGLREGGLDAVYDVTIGFPDAIPRTEGEFIRGVIPKEVHFHIRAFDARDLPSSETDLELWCRERWREKEERLEQFYAHGEFCETNPPGARSPEVPYCSLGVVSMLKGGAFLFSVSLVCVYCLLKSWCFLLFGVASVTWLIYQQLRGTGLDYTILNAHSCT